MRISPLAISIAAVVLLCGGAAHAKPAAKRVAKAQVADADHATATCVAALAQPNADPVDLAADQRRFVDGCKGVVAEPSCRAAWDRAATAAAGDSLVFFAQVIDGCRAAYCPLLPGHPAACDAGTPDMRANAELFALMLAYDVGPANATKITAALLDAAKRPGQTIVLPANPYCKAGQLERVSMLVGARGVWLGDRITGARCFVPRKDGAIDGAAMGVELSAMRKDGCPLSSEVAGAPGSTYGDLVAAMDASNAAWLRDVGVTTPDRLEVTFDDGAAAERRAPAHCVAVAPPPAKPVAAKPATPAPAPAKPAKPGATTPATLVIGPGSAAPDPQPDLAHAPIIVITPDHVELEQRELGSVKTLAAGKGSIPKLVALLRTTPAATAEADRRVVIIQADEGVDAAVIARVITSAKEAGFDQILFAVKNR